MSVAFGLGAKRPDHLRMTDVATFTHVDVTTLQLQRAVGLQAVHCLGSRFLKEQWDDFCQPTNTDYHYGENDQQRQILFYFVVSACHACFPLNSPSTPRARAQRLPPAWRRQWCATGCTPSVTYRRRNT